MLSKSQEIRVVWGVFISLDIDLPYGIWKGWMLLFLAWVPEVEEMAP